MESIRQRFQTAVILITKLSQILWLLCEVLTTSEVIQLLYEMRYYGNTRQTIQRDGRGKDYILTASVYASRATENIQLGQSLRAIVATY